MCGLVDLLGRDSCVDASGTRLHCMTHDSPSSLPTAGELIVHQLLLFIPVERLPELKLPKLRRRKRAGSTITGEDMEEEVEDEDVDAGDTEDTSRARVLWIRNLTRIQRQVRENSMYGMYSELW